MVLQVIHTGLYCRSGGSAGGLAMSRLTLRGGLAVVTVLLLAGACGWKRAANAAVPGGTAGIYSGSVTYYRFPGPVVSPPKRLLGAIRKDGAVILSRCTRQPATFMCFADSPVTGNSRASSTKYRPKGKWQRAVRRNGRSGSSLASRAGIHAGCSENLTSGMPTFRELEDCVFGRLYLKSGSSATAISTLMKAVQAGVTL